MGVKCYQTLYLRPLCISDGPQLLLFGLRRTAGDVQPLLDQCWVNVADGGPTLIQQGFHVLYWPVHTIDYPLYVHNVFFSPCRVVHCEAVDSCICFTRKIQHGGDWERSRPQGPKNVHNFLMNVRPLSWACGHGTEMLLILKKNYFWLDYPPICSDMTVQRNVPRFCTRSICGWNLFQPLGLFQPLTLVYSLYTLQSGHRDKVINYSGSLLVLSLFTEYGFVGSAYLYLH